LPGLLPGSTVEPPATGSPKFDEVAIEAGWGSPAVSSGLCFGISRRYPIAFLNKKELADSLAEALRQRVAELTDATDLKKHWNDETYWLSQANPHFFVVAEEELSGANVATAREKVERINSPAGQHQSLEEALVRFYLPNVRGILEQVREPDKGGRLVQTESIRAKEQPELRSWTQSDLDAEIRVYKARRSSTYDDLVRGVNQGKRGALKSARKMFGRNAIARELRVKAKAMVTNSPAWQEIARDLKLSPKHNLDRGINKTKRIGLDIALEKHADEQEEPTLEAVYQNEQKRLNEKAVIRLAKQKLPTKASTALIEKLRSGETTPEQALKVINLACTQTDDQEAEN
jgi:hypothetical protein